MLEDTWARQAAFLRYMADDEDGNPRRLCDAHQLHGALAYLRDAAGCALNVGTVHRLDGVNDKERRLYIFYMCADRIEVRLADDEQLIGDGLQTIGTHADLPCALLPRHIEDAASCPRYIRRCAQGKARFPDAGITDDEHHRSRYHTAAENAVELPRARRKARQILCADLRNRLRRLT